jgi:putative SOS response-associated peptidase YedK
VCNLYSITTNQAAIIALFRVMNRYVGNLPPMPGVFPDYPAPVVRNVGADRELTTMRWGMPPPPRAAARGDLLCREYALIYRAGLLNKDRPTRGHASG